MMPPDAPIAASAPSEAVRFTRPRLNICVLGGTGFVGTEIVSQLASAGHSIRVPTRAPARGQHLSVLPTVEIVAADVHDRRVLAGLLADMDAAINLVGILNESRRARFRDVHPGLAAKLIEEANFPPGVVNVVPGLGEEGDWLSALSAARIVTRTDPSKEKLRRELWSKVDV